MPPVELGMALSGFKAAREMLTAVVDGKNEIATMDRVLSAIRKLGEAQDIMYELREELLRKQEEVAALKGQLDEREKWEQEAAKYYLVKAEGVRLYGSRRCPCITTPARRATRNSGSAFCKIDVPMMAHMPAPIRNARRPIW